jgi:hypothetical protein
MRELTNRVAWKDWRNRHNQSQKPIQDKEGTGKFSSCPPLGLPQKQNHEEYKACPQKQIKFLFF